MINLFHIIKEHKLQIRGVIHVGAHFGQEFNTYRKCGINNIVFIEPCQPAFSHLTRKFRNNPNVKLLNYAAGNQEGQIPMYIESKNFGQSNSILKPKEHLSIYPRIKFHGKEIVNIRKLDSLVTEKEKYNLLVSDVQGFEMEVLKGATEILKGIDLIQLEVNQKELYEGNAMFDEIDNFLSDFELIEVKWWANHGWGDAIWKRQSPKMGKSIITVPKQFRPPHPFTYPPDNRDPFENWYYRNYTDSKLSYLPIQWTAYYCKNGFGKNLSKNKELQNFINKLDKKKKYYTIVQFDDGIVNDLPLDIKVFAMSGKRIDYPLPLLCPPHEFRFSAQRNIFASFVGSKTHEIRSEMMEAVKSMSGQFSFNTAPLKKVCDLMASSVFSLCPRGYGITSFRIVESLQYGAIPVYISDEFIFPHSIPFYTYGVTVKREEIKDLPDILRSISPEEIKHKQEAGKRLYHEYFTYQGCKKIIDKIVNE